MNEEEWADEAGGFFAEFAAETTQSKSNRKRNREANEQTEEQREEEQRQKQQSREQTAEAARKRIAAAIVSRASQKELRSLSRSSKANRGTGATATTSHQASATEAPTDLPRRPKTLKNKNAKLAAKLSRKEERKDQARVHALKNKKVLRKARR